MWNSRWIVNRLKDRKRVFDYIASVVDSNPGVDWSKVKFRWECDRKNRELLHLVFNMQQHTWYSSRRVILLSVGTHYLTIDRDARPTDEGEIARIVGKIQPTRGGPPEQDYLKLSDAGALVRRVEFYNQVHGKSWGSFLGPTDYSYDSGPRWHQVRGNQRMSTAPVRPLALTQKPSEHSQSKCS